MGWLYVHGDEKDDEKAFYWFSKAADRGHKGARAALEELGQVAALESDPYKDQRIKDVQNIAALLEEYKAAVGHYPFYDPAPAKEGFRKVGTLVALGSKEVENDLAQQPNPFRISATKAFPQPLKAN